MLMNVYIALILGEGDEEEEREGKSLAWQRVSAGIRLPR